MKNPAMDETDDDRPNGGRSALFTPPGDGSGAERVSRPRKALLSSSMVGSTNRGRVLQALFDLGPTSRVELARIAGVNRTTISGIVQPLIDDQVLVESDPIPANPGGGKPARPLWFSPNARPICGVLLMPDAVHACVATLDGKIECGTQDGPAGRQGAGSTDHRNDRRMRRRYARQGATARRSASVLASAAWSIPIADRSSPSISRRRSTATRSPTNSADASACRSGSTIIRAPCWSATAGSAPGAACRQFAVVYTGEVLGGALYFDGHLYRGTAGAGGELGHTFVQLDGELCRCGRRGCWDTIATLGWLRREAARAALPEPDLIDSARLVDMAARRLPGAAELLDRYARNVAVGIANLQQTVAPNIFILHGDVVLGGDRMLGAIADHVRAMVPARPGGAIEFVAGDAGDQGSTSGRGRAGDLGAAAVADLGRGRPFPARGEGK